MFLILIIKISNNDLIVSNDDSYEEYIGICFKRFWSKSSYGCCSFKYFISSWAAGIEEDIEKGFEKALFSMSKAKPWDKFLSLKAYLE